MLPRFFVLILLARFFFELSAQNLQPRSPLPAQVFYTNQIPFSFQPISGAINYELSWRTLSKAKKPGEWAKEKLSAPGVILKKGLSFGDTVEWHFQAFNPEGKVIYTSANYSFSIAPLPDPLKEFRLRVTQPRPGESIYFIDNTGAAWNRAGEVVWFLKPNTGNNRIMDLRLNSNGLLSLISVAAPNGKALLLSLTSDTIFDAHQAAGKNALFPYLTFHHHFEYLPDQSVILVGDIKPRVDFKDLNMGTGTVKKFPQVIINMTRNGKINWVWEADKYLSMEDNDCYGHINSVDYNPRTGQLLISMKDLSRIILDYPGNRNSSTPFSLNGINERSDKKLVAMSSHRAPVSPARPAGEPGRLQNLGEASQPPPRNRAIPKPGTQEVKGILGPFSGQHSVQFTRNGNLLMFNNNSYNPNSKFSTLLELKCPVKPEDDSEVVWQHILQFQDSLPKKAMGRGNVQITGNGELMTYMGQISRILETDTAHNLLWMGYLEHRADSIRNWQNTPGFKAFRASSLYPAFFTAELLNSGEGQNKRSIRLSNLGSESDTYLIKEVKGRILQKVTISPETQQSINVPESWPDKIEIHSTLNPSDIRKFDL